MDESFLAIVIIGLMILIPLAILKLGKTLEARKCRSAFKRKAKLEKKLEVAKSRLRKSINECSQLSFAFYWLEHYSEAESLLNDARNILPWKTLHLNSHSPLKKWAVRWYKAKKPQEIWGAVNAAYPHARQQQLKEYRHRFEKERAIARILLQKVCDLSRELGIERDQDLIDSVFELKIDNQPELVQARVEVDASPRAEIERIRVQLDDLDAERDAKRTPLVDRLAELEEEELAKQGGEGPHRRAAGIPRAEKPH